MTASLSLSKLAGHAAYFILWPVWMVYFRLRPDRTRVLVIYKDKVMLVKGLISDGSWNLPGGGLKKGETALQAAVREVKEETNIELGSVNPKHLGRQTIRSFGFKYNSIYFFYKLDKIQDAKASFPEIMDIVWADKQMLNNLKLSHDTLAGLTLAGLSPDKRST